MSSYKRLQLLSFLLKILTFIAFLLASLVGSFTIMYMFNNFVSNVFSITTINLPQAFGLDLLISYVTYTYVKNNNIGSFEIILASIVKSVIFLIVSKLLIVFFF